MRNVWPAPAPAISSDFTILAMMSAYIAVWLRQQREPIVQPTARRISMRVAAAVAMFGALGLVLGWVFFAWSTPDYPCFLWIVDDETHCGGKAR